MGIILDRLQLQKRAENIDETISRNHSRSSRGQ
jgi:hypothetical protein